MTKRLDYDVSIFVITSDSETIYVDEYDETDDGEGIFVMITNDILNSDYNRNNSIFLYKKWKEQSIAISQRYGQDMPHGKGGDYYSNGDWEEFLYWQITRLPISLSTIIPYDDELNHPDVKKYNQIKERLKYYVDGQTQTNDIIINANMQRHQYNVISDMDWSLNEYIPVIMESYNTVLDFNGKSYNGFLPAIGQLLYISENVVDINDTMKKIGGIMLPYKYNSFYFDWYSSNEFMKDNQRDSDVFVLRSSIPYTYAKNEIGDYHVLVLFPIEIN